MTFEGLDVSLFPGWLHLPLMIVGFAAAGAIAFVTLLSIPVPKRAMILASTMVVAMLSLGAYTTMDMHKARDRGADALVEAVETLYGFPITSEIAHELMHTPIEGQTPARTIDGHTLVSGGPQLKEETHGSSTFYIGNRQVEATLVWRSDQWVLYNQHGVQFPRHHDSADSQ